MPKPVNYLTNSLTGLHGEAGVFYDYILAGNGLFIRAKNAHLAATVCIAPAEVRGLAPLEESIHLLHGKVPMYILNLALSVLCIKPDIEQYLAVTWQSNYSLGVPAQSQTAASVTYETLPGTVLDIHSHVGGVPAHFSGMDDHDEQGFCLYAVVGGLRNLFPTVELRLGIYGYFMPIEKEEVFV
jgi:PRTRC genetic system protein A